AEQKQHLEENDARRPYRGRAAKPGQQVFGDDELDLEKQKRAQKNGGAEKRGGTAGLIRGVALEQWTVHAVERALYATPFHSTAQRAVALRVMAGLASIAE